MGKEIVTSIRIDKDLWKKAKILAIEEGTTLKELLERLLKEEIKKGSKNGSHDIETIN